MTEPWAGKQRSHIKNRDSFAKKGKRFMYSTCSISRVALGSIKPSSQLGVLSPGEKRGALR